MNLKKLQTILWGLVFVAALFAALIYVSTRADTALQEASDPTGTTLASTTDIGGPFTLLNAKGETVSEKTYAGKPTLMFFGFTHCPAICPGTLADISLWYEKLGKDADKLQTLFISVDPERDTPPVMADYLKAFDAHIVGLTGTPEQVAGMAKAYKVFVKKMPPMPNGGYMVNHSASILAFNAKGELVSTIDASENRDVAFEKIRKLIAAEE